MEFSYATTAKVSAERIWNLYSTVEHWKLWDTDLHDITLDGDFVTGSSGIMTMTGMPPMHFILDSVKEGKSFWDVTETPLGEIHFGHELTQIDPDTLHIRHTVRLDNNINTAETLDFLRSVFADVPTAVELLIREGSVNG